MKRIDFLKPYKGMYFNSKLRVTKQLAKIISLVSIIMLSSVFQGCEKEELFFQGDYLDVDMTQEVLSESDLEVYNQAQERMDEFVEVENNTYTTSLKSGISINISEELFSYFMNKMEDSNLLIKQKGFVLSGKTFCTSISIDQYVDCEIPRLKSTDLPEGDEEVVEGGINQVITELSWWGTKYYIYISDDTLRYSSYLYGAAAVVCGGTGVAAPLTIACGLSAIACQMLRDEYPNGIILSLAEPGNSICVPFAISEQ